MKTIAMMTLLLGTIAVGIAPAAEARADHERDRYEHARPGHGHDGRFERHGERLHARQVREIRTLAVRLERATDELQRDARRVVGRRDRGEAHALVAFARLETSADRFRRQTQGRDVLETRELRRDLRTVEDAFRHARRDVHALRRSRELHRDFRVVNALIDELGETLESRGRFAGWPFGHGERYARR
jgi:hypothetical protein